MPTSRTFCESGNMKDRNGGCGEPASTFPAIIQLRHPTTITWRWFLSFGRLTLSHASPSNTSLHWGKKLGSLCLLLKLYMFCTKQICLQVRTFHSDVPSRWQSQYSSLVWSSMQDLMLSECYYLLSKWMWETALCSNSVPCLCWSISSCLGFEVPLCFNTCVLWFFDLCFGSCEHMESISEHTLR